jgi:hypothetical protein
MPRGNEQRATWKSWACRLAGPLALLGLVGCAHGGGSHASGASAAGPSVRLAWLPLEPLLAADVVKTVNDRLGHLAVPGAARSYRAPVSMEVAQLALECIEPTANCYAAVGRSVGADRLLWAELGPGSESDESLRVAVVLFDVRGSAVLRRVEHTYDGLDAARAGVAALVDHALDVPGTRPASGSKSP